MVALFLAEDAATIFLHIKAHLAGLLLTGAETGAKIPVEELYAISFGCRLGS